MTLLCITNNVFKEFQQLGKHNFLIQHFILILYVIFFHDFATYILYYSF